jgi:hypothetical protein
VRTLPRPSRIQAFRWLAVLLLVAGNLSLQIVLRRDGLDNSVENRYSPTSTDSRDYVRRAEILAGKGTVQGPFGKAFEEALGDAYRMPAYPLFLSAFYPVFKAPLQAARYAQILLSALVILLAWLTLRNLMGDTAGALGGAALIAAWLPLYYFSPILIAESCSLFVFAALLYAMSRPVPAKHAAPLSWMALPLLFATWVYLKPNHILLLAPLAAFVWMRERRGGTHSSSRGLVRAILCILVVLAVLAPWSVFISRQHGKPLLLSTASGVNLYLGTGVIQSPAEANTLPYKYAARMGMIQGDSLVRSASGTAEAMEAEEARLAAGARSIWRAHPLRTAGYGVAKALHGFGFSLRGARDVLLLAFLALSVLASARAWKTPAHRPWAVFFWGVLLVTFLQMFVYLPNQRFKTLLFDLPAWIILVLGARRRETPDPSA